MGINKKITQESSEKYVPTKNSLARQSNPWMNTHLIRVSRRAYSKAKIAEGLDTVLEHKSGTDFNVSLDDLIHIYALHSK